MIEETVVAVELEMERIKQVSRDLLNEKGEEWQRRYDKQHEINEDNWKAINECYDRERVQQTREDKARQARKTIKDRAQGKFRTVVRCGITVAAVLMWMLSMVLQPLSTEDVQDRVRMGISQAARISPWVLTVTHGIFSQQTTNTPILYDGGRGMADQDSCSTYHEDGALPNVLFTFADRVWIRLMRLRKCGFRITSVRTERPQFCNG